MLKRIIILAAVGAVAMPAVAQDKPKDKAVEIAKNDPNRVICRSVRSTESRLGSKRECHTKAEWDQATTRNGEQVRNAGGGY